MLTRPLQVIRFLNRLERIVTAVTASILGLLTLVVGWEVFARYVLQSGQFWAEEFCLIAMMWAALLGAAACLWTDSHVRVTFTLSFFPVKLRRWILAFTDLVILWFSYVFFKESLLLIQRTMGGQMSALKIPIGSTYFVLPLSAFLMILFTVARGIKRFASNPTNAGGKR
jgi:TRAP-type C4-dicarboxylate transport system permease small subunit